MHEVVIASRTQANLAAAKGQVDKLFTSFRKNLSTAVLDIQSEDAVRDFFAQTQPFDHLVVTAGALVTGNFIDLDTSAARKLFETKFWGQFLAAKYAAGKIKRGGSITFFTGSSYRPTFSGLSVLHAMSGAVESFARTLALELAPTRVNVISTGVIANSDLSNPDTKARQELFRTMADILPVKRVGKPEDVASTVLLLMQNTFTTGTVIHIDGGHQRVQV